MSHEQQIKWDVRFLEMAKLVASWSRDPSTKCGAVVVRPDKSVASVGFNGFPMRTDDDPALYEDRDTKLSRVIHAEQNALLLAREWLKDCTLYTYPPGIGPTCDRCAAHVIQAGITRVVHYYDESRFGSRWREPAERGLKMYEEAQVAVHRYVEGVNDSTEPPWYEGEVRMLQHTLDPFSGDIHLRFSHDPYGRRQDCVFLLNGAPVPINHVSRLRDGGTTHVETDKGTFSYASRLGRKDRVAKDTWNGHMVTPIIEPKTGRDA